jgi:hypothetical protein
MALHVPHYNCNKVGNGSQVRVEGSDVKDPKWRLTIRKNMPFLYQIMSEHRRSEW